MGEIVRYVESDGTSHDLSTLTGVKYLSGEGLDIWQVTPTWDELSADYDSFAGFDLGRAQIGLRFVVNPSTYDNVRGTFAAMRAWFMKDVSRGTPGSVQMVLDNGGTYTIKAAISTPDIPNPQSKVGFATFKYESDSIFWKYGAQVSAAGTFAGTTQVNVAWNNTGEWPTPPIHILSGSVDTPRLTNVATGKYIEIGTTWAGSADQLWIWINPVNVRHYAAGANAGIQTLGSAWAGYAGTVSTFFNFDIGAGSVQLSAASGSPTYEMRYDILKAGLG